MDNVCNRCLFSIPSKVEMAEEQEYLRSPQLFKGPEFWSGRGLNPRPPARQSGALPTELTGRQLAQLIKVVCECN